uniref:GIR1-like zinc ribbon domain-containing protein n=1 Tax=Kalanchoe fedtschenkoi TaxID=63787 RepID=A0A7N1A5J1_KALFE
MAADVGYPIRGHHSQDDQRHLVGNETPLITRDLLGESFSKIDHTQELDLDLQVPAGWEKRLDLKSGKVYLQKCNSQSNPPASKDHTKCHTIVKRPLSIMEDTSLDLKLVSSEAPPATFNNSCTYQSVCTLDKVKSALDRAKNEQLRRMFFPVSSRSPSGSSTSAKVMLELEKDAAEEDGNKTAATCTSQQQGLLSAAGCPNCLLYVMISKDNPKCPKCNSIVSLPVVKKPRIDLNLNISI